MLDTIKASNVGMLSQAQVAANANNKDPRTETGWWSSLTGGETEKRASVAQADYDRNYQAQEALKARKFSSAEAQINRDYQERMSNTSYQRAISDMKKAGLNPAMLYASGGHGASTPSSSAASASSSPSGRSTSPTAGQTGQLATIIASVIGAGFVLGGKVAATSAMAVKEAAKIPAWVRHKSQWR